MDSQTLGPATVICTGSIYPTDGGVNVLRNAKLSFIGCTPNATVKLYSWEMRQDEDGKPTSMGFIEFDKLTEAKVVEDAKTGHYLIEGISERFTEEFRHDPELDEESIGRWDVEVTGRCADCG